VAIKSINMIFIECSQQAYDFLKVSSSEQVWSCGILCPRLGAE